METKEGLRQLLYEATKWQETCAGYSEQFSENEKEKAAFHRGAAAAFRRVIDHLRWILGETHG